MLLQTAANLDRKHIIPAAQPSDTLYLHWPFHPNGLTTQDIWCFYDKTLKPMLDYDNMQITISRPKNLKDILTCSVLAVADYPLVKGILSRCVEQKLASKTDWINDSFQFQPSENIRHICKTSNLGQQKSLQHFRFSKNIQCFTLIAFCLLVYS